MLCFVVFQEMTVSGRKRPPHQKIERLKRERRKAKEQLAALCQTCKLSDMVARFFPSNIQRQ